MTQLVQSHVLGCDSSPPPYRSQDSGASWWGMRERDEGHGLHIVDLVSRREGGGGEVGVIYWRGL